MGRAKPLCFISLALFIQTLFGVSGAFASQPTGWDPRRIEVFTAADIQITETPSFMSSPGRSEIELQLYQLDDIQRLEAQLSNTLPTEPDRSKQIALQRIQQLDKRAMAAVQNTAVGLAKAMQYGVDRYPAIVFDGEVVVYGLTDLSSAFDHYQTWREGVQP